MPWPIPTARTAAALAVVALGALVVPLGLVAAAALALLAATAADAWAVRHAPTVQRRAPTIVSLRAPAALSVAVRAADDRRALVRQPATAALRVIAGDGSAPGPGLALALRQGEAEVALSIVGTTRGVHELPGVASASVGPLGLARVHHPPGPPAAVRVYPDLVNARALVNRLRRDLAGQAGRAARGALGLGTDFESIREYTPDDDIRQLNWRATARMGRPMSNQYRLERDRDVVCLIDCGRLMAAPAGARTLLDVALDAVTVLALAADELGDRCGAIAFDDEIRVALGPRHRAARRVLDALLSVQPSSAEADFERACARVGGSRRALVVVFSDLVDEAAARSLTAAVPMLARRHAVIVASARDEGLEARAAGTGPDELAHARALVASEVLEARARAAAQLRRAGATVLEARAAALGSRCLRAYLEAKARARL